MIFYFIILCLVTIGTSDRLYKTFDFSSRDAVNADWSVLNWNPGVVNHEKQQYTDSLTNVYTDNNTLVLRAKKDGAGFTSGRLESKETFSPLNFGTKKMRIAYTATVPAYQGAWPGLWMNGDSATYGNWPKTGEIDVMEWVWSINTHTLSSLHWKSGNDYGQPNLDYPGGINDIRAVHTYRVDVSAIPGKEYVQFSMDDNWHTWILADKWKSTYHPDKPCGQPEAKRCSGVAPFDNQMTLILNLAVGGDWGGVGTISMNQMPNANVWRTQPSLKSTVLGVNNYDAFNGDGITMNVHNVSVWELSP